MSSPLDYSKILGVDVDTAYAIVIGVTLFCMILAAIAWVRSKIIEYKTWKLYMLLHGGDTSDSDKNKSRRK